MSPVNLTIRGVVVLAAWLGLVGPACAPEARRGATATGAAGAAGPGAAGDPGGAAGAGAGSAGGGPGAAGMGPDPGGAAGSGAAGATMGTVPSGSGGTVDQGRLFTDAAALASVATDAGAASAPEVPASGDAGGKTSAGDGNTSTCHVGGMSYVLVFTQKGTDVTMVVTATGCATGSHTIQIRGGFSCDNAGTEGGVWDGKRGDGIPALTCANNKGTLTYTRSGADPATSWTVGDHSTKTDVTLHPMSVDTSCGTFF